MVNQWFISDQHFGHENIYKFVDEHGVRVRPEFDRSTEADEYMVEMHNQIIKPQDHVYFLGDVGFSNEILSAIVPKLHGHKRLALGNHDTQSMGVYSRIGFKKIQLCYRYAGLLFTHVPVAQFSLDSPKIIANVHGHTHEKLVPYLRSEKPYFNVCVEQTQYRPLHLDEILSRVNHARLAQTLEV